MSDPATIVRQLLWHLQKAPKLRHLFVPSEPYDEIKAASALYLVTAFQSSGHEAKLLMGEGWGQKMPLEWPEDWFIRDLKTAEKQKWDNVWLWGFENQSGRGLDRKGKSALRTTRLKSLFKNCDAVLQLIGLHDATLKVGRLSTPSVRPDINYEGLKIKTDKKKMDAGLRDNLRDTYRKHIDGQVGEMRAHRHHFFECDNTGGLVELAFLLGREVRGTGDFRLLLGALKTQLLRFPEITSDPIMVQFLNVLESKCLS